MDQLSTKRCLLTAITEQDIITLLAFFERAENLYYYLPTELKNFDLKSLETELSQWSDGQSNLAWAIRLKSGETIGIANFEDIDYDNLTAELGLLIAFPEYRGRGLAKEVAQSLFRYAFEDLALNRVSCRVMEGNEASFRLIASLGFRKEGIMVEALRRPDRYLDLHYFALLKREWLQEETVND
ncbi:MAG: GNAT family protein [Eubacteriales bacterium]|nr:GNAT family protein [Eubacteriales bacterium]